MLRMLFGVLLLLCVSCTTYRDQLARGQRAFELEEHDRTLAILRDLEPDVPRLTPAEQAQYAYLRGMTDYRIGYKADARHWLSVTKAYEDNSPGVLPADWKARTNDVLEELNGVVYSAGTSALTTARADEDAEEPKAERVKKHERRRERKPTKRTDPEKTAPAPSEVEPEASPETPPAN